MVRTRTAVLGVAGTFLAAVGAWNLYQRYSTEQVPYTVVARVDDVELRRYPSTVLVETVAPSEREAFGRLFGYISGANDGDVDVAMTAPVEVEDEGESVDGTSIPMTAPVAVSRGEEIPMTTPVETDERPDGVRMAFYLPPEYDAESAPEPTDPSVELVAVPERTLAVQRFSWRPTDDRVAEQTERLIDTLESANVPTSGAPFFMGYDAPGTLPFLRRNEVAIEVEAAN